jgi:pimeloyl-ACP methyl ester carboxylesterase
MSVGQSREGSAIHKTLACSVLLVLVLGGTARGQARVETGELNGAKFRIDMPAKWNGGLVLYCHGYAHIPLGFAADRPARFFVADGYAVAESGYSAGGYAVREAVHDTEALRRYFISKHGKPRETWLTGESMGGLVVLMLMETFPESYDGGLPACAPLAPASWFIKAQVFDLLVLFEHFFPKLLPSPASVPGDFVMTRQRPLELMKALDGKSEAAATLRAFSSARSNDELAHLLDLYTYVLMELQRRYGGNPFDNRDTLYTGPGLEPGVNDAVKRYEAAPRAAELLRNTYTPTGRISSPLLAVHTLQDAVVPPWIPNRYAEIAAQAGRGGLFAQKYTAGAGHCRFRTEEIRAAFSELRRWKQSGERPRPGRITP